MGEEKGGEEELKFSSALEYECYFCHLLFLSFVAKNIGMLPD